MIFCQQLWLSLTGCKDKGDKSMESLSDTRIIDLGIRGVQSRIRGARIQTLLTHLIGRLIAIGAIVWVGVELFTLIDFANPALFPDGHLLDALSFLFIILELIALIIFTAPLMLFLAFSSSDAGAILYGARAFLTVDLFNNVQPPVGIDSDVLFGVDPTDLFSPFEYLFAMEVIYPLKAIFRASILMFFVILLGIALVAFLFKADMRSAAAAFVSIQFIVFYGSAKHLFKSNFRFSPTKNIGELFTNDVVLIALSSYLFLEISLQISYISQILNPAQSRQQRVLRALDRLSEFRLGITGAPTPSPVLTAETEEDEEEKKAGQSIGATGSSIARKFGVSGMTYFLEKASDSLFARPGGQQDKLTSRLQRYHDGLVHSDPRVDEKLVGAAVTVKPLMTIIYVLTSVLFRVLIMLGGLYVILNPDILLFILRYPPSIYNSLEMLQPEGVVLLLIPIVVIVLLLTSLIGYIQERFSSRFEDALDPILEDQEFLEEELPGVITEGELEPISEEDTFYEQLTTEFGEGEEE
ncbi:MAG: hypothetical protein H7644_08150 [Candidatus Heimdallarchaeota archaeon]|nr:hypothetical protein [Candidatus Heimdallarchaeota archaeon]